MCDSCPKNYKSLGFQYDDCQPCTYLRDFGTDDFEMNKKTWERLCYFSEIKSGWVMIITMLTSAIVGFLFLAGTKYSSKQENKFTVVELEKPSVERAESLDDKEVDPESERKPMISE